MNEKIQLSKDFSEENSLRIAVSNEITSSSVTWSDFIVPYGHELLIEALVDYLKAKKVFQKKIYVVLQKMYVLFQKFVAISQ